MECIWRPGSGEGEAGPWVKSWLPRHAGSLTPRPQGGGCTTTREGIWNVFDGVAQEKRGGWPEFNGKINSRGKPVLLFSFFVTAADTSGICGKLPPASHLVQGNMWPGMQGQGEKLLGEAKDSRPGAAEKANSASEQLSAQHEAALSSSPGTFSFLLSLPST